MTVPLTAIAVVLTAGAATPSSPARPALVAKEPSAQSIETCQGPSEPESLNEPMLKRCEEPSLLDWFAAAVRLGARLLT